MMSRGSHVAAHRDDGGEGLRDGRPPASTGRSEARAVLDLRRRTQSEHPVVVRGIRQPVAARVTAQRRARASGRARCRHDLAVLEARAEVGAGAGPGEQAAVGVAPEHDLATGDGAQQRAARGDVGGGRGDEPAVGGSAERGGEGASIRAGLASRQVPRRWSGVVWGR